MKYNEALLRLHNGWKITSYKLNWGSKWIKYNGKTYENDKGEKGFRLCNLCDKLTESDLISDKVFTVWNCRR